MPDGVPIAPSLEPMLEVVRAPCEDEAPIGALLVGVIARYGSASIRGHGIPEAMEQVLLNESRISPTVMRLKPVVISDDSSSREAADHMVHERVGRLPVVSRTAPHRVIGIVSRSDLLEAHEQRLQARHRVERTIDLSQTLGWVRPTER